MNLSISSRLAAIVVPVALALAAGGCAPVGQTANGGPPQGCDVNTGVSVAAATAPLAGAVTGAAIGAIVSQGNAGATALGGLLGGMIGTAAAQQANAECHAYAMRRALDLAMQENASRQAAYDQAQAEEQDAEQRGERIAARRYRREMAEAKAREQQHTYSSTAYRSSNGQTGVITPLSNDTDPATKQVCMTVNDSQTPGQGRYCRDASGNWAPVTPK